MVKHILEAYDEMARAKQRVNLPKVEVAQIVVSIDHTAPAVLRYSTLKGAQQAHDFLLKAWQKKPVKSIIQFDTEYSKQSIDLTRVSSIALIDVQQYMEMLPPPRPQQ